MIDDPTDVASDEDWDAPEETADESSAKTTEGNSERASTASKGSREGEDDLDDELDTSPADDDEEEDTGETEEAGESGDEGPTEGHAKKRRRRKKRVDSIAAPDDRAQAALDFVTKVVREMEMDCRVRLRRPKNDEDDEVNIEIIGKDAGRIIGKKGSVLQAIQFLTHRVINRPGLDRHHVLVDAEGYRSRRDNSLATMARRLGKQAVDQGKIITFEPMNPRDRRVVHLALAKFEGVITKSDGEGDDRRVQIIPVRR